MLHVYKYPLHERRTAHLLPRGAKVLTARYQDSEYGKGVMLYALAYPTAPKVDRLFTINATGNAVVYTDEAQTAKYVATVELPDNLVYHIFEIC